MRPLELTLRNFRSYFGEDKVFDFRDRSLVGIVGPIGSGKSSLLDAIAFGLFGRTPTVASGTKSLIHQRADGATVSLRFTVDSEVWEVTRALRRKGQSVHGLHRLESDEPDAERVETFVLEGEVNEKIVDLLGLEFDGFSRSIMLAQGRFAEFLRARPAERDKVLKGVFGHDRIDAMRTTARERSAAESAAVENLSARLEAADSLAARIARGQELLAAGEQRLELLRKAETKFQDAAERSEATERIISHSVSRLDELDPLVDRIPGATAVEEVVGISQSAMETRDRLGSALTAAQEQLTAADRALAALDPPSLRHKIDEASRTEAKISQLEAQATQLVKQAGEIEHSVTDLENAIAAAKKAEKAATKSVAAAEARKADAESARNEVAKALHAARHGDMAATLRGTLEVGAECPVCAVPVAELPPRADSPQVAAAEAQLGEAEQLLAGRVKEHAEAASRVVGAANEVAGLEAQRKAAKEEAKRAKALVDAANQGLAAAKAALGDLVGAASAEELKKQLDSAELAVTEARKRVDVARAEHDEAIRASQAADKKLGELRITIAEVAARLGIESGATDAPSDVATALTKLRSSLAAELETLTTAKKAAEQERAEINASVRELRRELDIDGEFTTLLAEVAAQVEVRRKQIEEEQEELAKSDSLRVERDAALKRVATYEALAGELTDSKFVRYLLDEEKRDLAGLGSEHFERLSSGRYRFSDDGQFHIVDLTSADAIRKADSLSGGETFLASLALALALAEMVARGGGKLDAFFLDEGFGSLDPEHLDLAMDGIEQLAAGAADRLVLVVSHVPDMQQRIEDLIELDRDPVTGDTVVIRG